MEKYVEVRYSGMTCVSDGFIADAESQTLFFASLIGRPAVVKAISAAILEGYLVRFGMLGLGRARETFRTISQGLGYGIAHRILLCEDYFTGPRARIVVDEDKQRAFEFLDSVVSTPLKDEWADNLWDMVFEPKEILGFGSIQGQELKPVYLITLDKTVDEVDHLVL